MVYATPDSEWMRRSAPVRRALAELRCNIWPGTDAGAETARLVNEMASRAAAVIRDLDPRESASPVCSLLGE